MNKPVLTWKGFITEVKPDKFIAVLSERKHSTDEIGTFLNTHVKPEQIQYITKGQIFKLNLYQEYLEFKFLLPDGVNYA